MPRKKKGFNFSRLMTAAVLIVGTWIAADYYFNVYRPAQKKTVTETAPVVPAATEPVAAPAVQPEPEVVSADGFTAQPYRDDRYGIEFQYPVYGKEDARCPVIKKTDDGFSIGMFSLVVSEAPGELSDFVEGQLEGMTIDKNESLTVAGFSATRVDYQTQGMGWYGSDVYLKRNGKVYDFGILANATPGKCGGIDDYEDRVYQSVIATLKFVE